MMRNRFFVLLLVLLLGILLLSAASAGEAENISSRCKFKIDSHALKATRLVDGTYTKYWYSGEMKNPYLGISSPEPMYGLYLCFREMPDSYVIQRRENDEWVDLLEGDTRFYHVFYELSGETDIRIFSTQQKKHRLMLNELFVFGAGDVPDWVQRWNDTEEKADILFLVAHPDDELIFLAGAIPTYDVELEKRVVVAYLTFANKTRRSEALNGLWTMGVRNYPVFGPFPDAEGSLQGNGRRRSQRRNEKGPQLDRRALPAVSAGGRCHSGHQGGIRPRTAPAGRGRLHPGL